MFMKQAPFLLKQYQWLIVAIWPPIWTTKRKKMSLSCSTMAKLLLMKSQSLETPHLTCNCKNQIERSAVAANSSALAKSNCSIGMDSLVIAPSNKSSS
jgi:hypothetical protein